MRKLGEKEWEFENAKKAFGDTMRKFAPGGGAGHFLANAIARRTDAVSLSWLTAHRCMLANFAGRGASGH